jgi:hypothetical protein
MEIANKALTLTFYSEPLLTFTFWTKQKLDQNRLELYTQYFLKKFPFLFCRISEGSIKSQLVCLFSQTASNIKSITEENPCLDIAGDRLLKGQIRIPLPHKSVWDSGLILSFSNAKQLEQKLAKCVMCMLINILTIH